SPEGMTFVSTDAHKLVKLTRPDVKAAKAAQFIVPKKALGLLKGTLPESDTGVNVSYNKSNAFFSFDNTKLICRLIDANYPDYNAGRIGFERNRNRAFNAYPRRRSASGRKEG